MRSGSLHNVLWLLAPGALCLGLWGSGASPDRVVPAAPEDTTAVFRQDFSGCCGAELVDTAANRIGGNMASLAGVFEKFRRLEALRGSASCSQMDSADAFPREVASLLHLGDSHVQGGYFTEPLRKGLQQRFGSAGRGLLTPYRLMKTNQPPGYEISSPNAWSFSRCIDPSPEPEVGATGAAIATTERSVELTIGVPGEPFESVLVLHHPQAPLLEAGEQALGMSCPWEDSPTMTRVPLRGPTERVTLRAELPQEGYDLAVFNGFSLENGLSGLLYHSVGINGNSFQAMLRNPQVVYQAAQLAPDLILISLGTNDSFGRNFSADQISGQLTRLIALCRQAAPGSALLLTTPMECFSRLRSGRKIISRLNPNSEKVREVILETARREGIAYWDFYAAAGGEGAMARWNGAGLSRPDKVHLTVDGYRLQGEMLLQAFFEAYSDYVTSL